MVFTAAFFVCTSTVLSAPFPTAVKTAATPEAFVPAGWRIERTLSGDLDGDTIDDAVVVLVQPQGTRERALLVLLKRKATWALVASNQGLLQCGECAGAKGDDGAPEMKIAARVLTVHQLFGSRTYGTSTHRFRLDKNKRMFQLIGLDTSSGDSLLGTSGTTSTNLLTGLMTSEGVSCAAPCNEENPQLESKRATSKQKKQPLLSLEQVKGS